MAGRTPGKLNNAMWEQNIPESAKPLTGNKAKVSLFEQAAKDAAEKPVIKKKTWSGTGNSGGGTVIYRHLSNKLFTLSTLLFRSYWARREI